VKKIDTIVADGAYYRASTIKMAEEKKLLFSVSAMTGGNIPENRIRVNEFQINEQTHRIETCLSGNVPFYAEYNADKEVYRAKFAKPDCQKCLLLKKCPIELKREMNTFRFTEKKLQADRMRTKIETVDYKQLANFRAGVEGLPSVLRRVYRIDRTPSRGFVRSKIWIHCKIMAYNIKQVVHYIFPLFLTLFRRYYFKKWIISYQHFA
jgi:hypothetical protein